MHTKPAAKKPAHTIKNPLEQDLSQEKRQSLMDAFFGAEPAAREQYEKMMQEKEEPKKRLSGEFTIFDGTQDAEKRMIPRQIEQLSSEIRQELSVLKTKSAELESEAAEIEKHTIQAMPEKPGIYHLRFMELLLSFLKNLTAKVGEAKTWMAAMQSKKAKRGSAFAARSKKQGTQYSMSQELSTARAVQ